MFTMKINSKKIISVLLVTAILFSALSVLSFGAVPTTSEITSALNTYKSNIYRQNWYWCGGNLDTSFSYSVCGDPGCICNSFNGAYQCQGFALYLVNRVIGSYPGGRLSSYRHGATSNGWRCYTSIGMGKQALCTMGLQVGDVVRAASDAAYSDGHTAVVWKIEDGKVYFAESWGSVYCKINWGGFNYYYYTLDDICNAYSYVAVWRNTSVVYTETECEHAYTETSEAPHPHRIIRTCQKCGISEYTGQYASVSDCVCCQGNHDYAYSHESSHPHRETATCKKCGNFIYTGNTKYNLDCQKCISYPAGLEVSLSSDRAAPGDTVTLNFNALNAVAYSVLAIRDGANATQIYSGSDGTCAYTLEKTGSYTFNVSAFSAGGNSVSSYSSRLVVSLPLSNVDRSNGKYTLTFDASVSEELAAKLCEERYLTLESHGDDGFSASFEAADMPCENIGEYAYTYIPLSLSYHEAQEFCLLSGGELAAADSEEVLRTLTSLCGAASSDGILTDASDFAKEGSWVTSDGTVLENINWNPSYTEIADIYRNYLFMFPDGSFTDSYELPSAKHGFVIRTDADHRMTFGYNEDGTFLLRAVELLGTKSFTVPESFRSVPVTGIGAAAFAGVNAEEITIPSGITFIEKSAFDSASIGRVVLYKNSCAHDHFKNSGIPMKYILPFEDIEEGAWYYNSLDYCYQMSYISGISDKSFDPNGTVTREMFICVLARIAEADLSKYEGKASFDDVEIGSWYASSVEWGYANGVTNGVSSIAFGVGQSITREQMATMLANFSGAGECEYDLSAYTDLPSVSSWALNAMKWAAQKSIITGVTETTLSPASTATRAQLAAVLQRYCNLESK